jgi:hypothetical protein
MCYRSVACILNTSGARLWQSANAISSSAVAGQFMEEFQGEVDSMKPVKAIQCLLYELNIPHRHQIRGFSLSQYSCPEGTQLVTSLLKALLSKSDEQVTQLVASWSLMEQVCIWCFVISPSNHLLPCAVRFWKPGGSIQLKTNSRFNPWMERIAVI